MNRFGIESLLMFGCFFMSFNLKDFVVNLSLRHIFFSFVLQLLTVVELYSKLNR